MNHPPTPSKDRELTKKERWQTIFNLMLELDGAKEVLEEYIQQDRDSLKQSLVAEMPKKIDIEIQPNPSENEYIEWGIKNHVLTQVDQAITKVLGGEAKYEPKCYCDEQSQKDGYICEIH
jgi:hypothetical protein